MESKPLTLEESEAVQKASQSQNEPTLSEASEPIDLDNTPLTFGKYKGETPKDVADSDPHWLYWAFKNVTNNVTCSPELAAWCAKRPKPNHGTNK